MPLKHKRIHQMTVAQWEATFPNEEACCAYLVAHRWPKGITCPRCGASADNPITGRPFKWQCYRCNPNGYQFSHIAGTIFENTNKPLRQWFRVIHMMLTSKKGVSSLQVYRVMGFGSYETALYMCNRIRAGLANEEFRKLMGVVEVDETFVGGKAKNRHKDKRGDGSGGTGGKGKVVVAGAVQRRGNVVARVISNVRADTLTAFIRDSVSEKVSLLVTDHWVGYKHLRKEFPQHEVINHAAGQYVIGAIHTNTIEGFWSIFKRGVVGTFHKMSRKYMPLYVAEFQFRYNNRENPDIFGEAIKGC